MQNGMLKENLMIWVQKFKILLSGVLNQWIKSVKNVRRELRVKVKILVKFVQEISFLMIVFKLKSLGSFASNVQKDTIHHQDLWVESNAEKDHLVMSKTTLICSQIVWMIKGNSFMDGGSQKFAIMENFQKSYQMTGLMFNVEDADVVSIGMKPTNV